ncbi:DinB family protein [Actinocrispum sp. NPDC049592]|uniref:DinB family protein n=1 Tax=Actinocrispum sp. NPDC049592 TaxID=3154835 RepID=UPI003430A90D
MATSRDDLLDLSDFAYTRLRDRMAGLTDREYHWAPAAGFTTLVWRLGHIIEFLRAERIGSWLGQDPLPAVEVSPSTALEVLAALEQAYQTWRGVLAATTEESLAEPIGFGPYGQSTRRAFALHILDELIHHGAEAALMRDLYATPLSNTDYAHT